MFKILKKLFFEKRFPEDYYLKTSEFQKEILDFVKDKYYCEYFKKEKLDFEWPDKQCYYFCCWLVECFKVKLPENLHNRIVLANNEWTKKYINLIK